MLAPLAALLVLLAPGVAAAAADPASSDLFARVNDARAQAGAGAVEHHPQIAEAARVQAEWLAGLSPERRAALTGTEAHCGGPGCPPVRALAAGWPDRTTTMAEIAQIAGRSNAPSAQAANVAAIAAWQASPMHRTHLLAQGWRFAGVAIVGEIGLVIFADRCAADGCVGGTSLGGPTGASGSVGAATPPGATATGTSASPETSGAAGSTACSRTVRTRLLRRRSGRLSLEVRLPCGRVDRGYVARVKAGQRRRTARLRKARTVVTLRVTPDVRWVTVRVDRRSTRIGTVRLPVAP